MSRLLLVGFLLMIGLRSEAAGQAEPSKQTEQGEIEATAAARITLGIASGMPGAAVVVPIFFAPAENMEVGLLTLEVTYVSVNMKFSKVDTGPEMENVGLRAEVKNGKNDKGVETETLTITASVSNPSSTKKGIPEGLLGYLNLNISETARPASITLRVSAKAEELGTNKPLKGIRTSNSEVDVLAEGENPPTAVTCFFFTH